SSQAWVAWVRVLNIRVTWSHLSRRTPLLMAGGGWHRGAPAGGGGAPAPPRTPRGRGGGGGGSGGGRGAAARAEGGGGGGGEGEGHGGEEEEIAEGGGEGRRGLPESRRAGGEDRREPQAQGGEGVDQEALAVASRVRPLGPEAVEDGDPQESQEGDGGHLRF